MKNLKGKNINNVILAFFAVFLLCVPGALGLSFGKIRHSAIYDGAMELHYNARNNLYEDVENAKLNIWIPDLDFSTRTSTFDIDSRDKHGQIILLYEEDLERGTYLARMTLSSDHHRDIRWIWVTIE